MALSGVVLAPTIATAVLAPGVTPEILAFSDAVVVYIQDAGVASIGKKKGSLSDLVGQDMADAVTLAMFPPPPPPPLPELPEPPTPAPAALVAICEAIAEHLNDATIITYSDDPAYAIGGVITGPTGPAMAAIASAKLKIVDPVTYLLAPTAQLLGKCTAIAAHMLLGIATAEKIL